MKLISIQPILTSVQANRADANSLRNMDALIVLVLRSGHGLEAAMLLAIYQGFEVA